MATVCAFDELFVRNLRAILDAIFADLPPPDIKHCQLVCKRWRNFLRAEAIDSPTFASRRKAAVERYLWKEAQWTSQKILTGCTKWHSCFYDKNKLYGVGDDEHIYVIDGTTLRESNKVSVSPPLHCFGSHPGHKNDRIEFVGRYALVCSDGSPCIAYDRFSFEKIAVVDIDKGKYGGPSAYFSHLTTVGGIEDEVYAVAQKCRATYFEDPKLALYKFARRGKSFRLKFVCSLPFSYQSVYEIHNIYAGGSPLQVRIGPQHVVVLGCNSVEMLFDHRKKAVVKSRTVPDLEYYGAQIHIGETFYSYVIDKAEGAVLVLNNLDTGDLIRRVDLGSLKDYSWSGLVACGKKRVAYARFESQRGVEVRVIEHKSADFVDVTSIHGEYVSVRFAGADDRFVGLCDSDLTVTLHDTVEHGVPLVVYKRSEETALEAYKFEYDPIIDVGNGRILLRDGKDTVRKLCVIE